MSVQDVPIIWRADIEMSFSLPGSSEPLVYREDFMQMDCSQSVGMKIWRCEEISQIYATRDICSIEDSRGRHFWAFSDPILCNDFITRFVDTKTLLRDHTGVKVCLTKFQSRSNVK